MIFFRLITVIIFSSTLISCHKNNDQAAKTMKNLAYGNELRQKLDVYLPANRNINETKVFIWIHGGAWSSGDKSEFTNLKPVLDTALDNYAFVSLNYRLFDANTGENRFPNQELDIQLALDFIASKLSEWKLSNNVIIGGASAGGHLALLQAYKHNSNGLIKACVAYFPPTEMASFYYSNAFATLVLHGLFNGAPNDYYDAYFDASPLNFITSSSVPTLFFHGNQDDVVPLSQSELLQSKLIEEEVHHDYLFFDGEGHGFNAQNTTFSIHKMSSFLKDLGY